MAAGNSVFDEIMEQHKLMKGRPLKEQVEYYVGYYWKMALVTAAALGILISFIYSAVTAKEEALCILFVNTFIKEDVDMQAYGAELTELLALDPDDYSINIQKDLWIDYENMDEISSANIQKLLVLHAAAAIDGMIVNDTYLEANADSGILGDLSEVLPPELMEKYKDRIIYVDSSIDEKGEYPALLDVSDASIMESPTLPAYFCLSQVTPHPENTIAFLEYLLGE